VRCKRMTWFVTCSYLFFFILSGCRYGEKNASPVAPDYAATTAQGVPVTIAVLARATDADGDRLKVVSVTQGNAGAVTLNADGTVTYNPDDGFSGTDSFRYTIDDDHGARASGRVTVTVLPQPGVVVDGTLYTVTAFIPAGAVAAVAWGINDSGQMAGSILLADGRELPVFIDSDGHLTVINLGVLPLARAHGVNNRGLVAGFFLDPDHEHLDAGEEHDHDHDEPVGLSFVWDASAGRFVSVFEVPTAQRTVAFKINDAGQVVGQLQGSHADDHDDAEPEHAHDDHAHEDGDHDHDDDELDHERDDHDAPGATSGFLRQPDGTITALTIPGTSNTFPTGINNRGQIVGSFTAQGNAEGLRVGFLLNPDGSIAAFNVLDADGQPLWTHADAINDAGVIVGHFKPVSHEHDHEHNHDDGDDEEGDEAVLPFLRKPDGTILRFNMPGAVQGRFAGLNNLGAISGFSVDEGGFQQAVVLTPVRAEPNTFFPDTPADAVDHDHDHDR
jgi:uncharacterized membrane protein